MKKMAALFFVLVFLLGTVGCNPQPTQPEQAAPDFTEQSVIIRDSHSDVEGLSVQVDGIYHDSDKTTLVVSWNNTTEHTVTYGEMFGIERLENDEWVDCALGENVFIMIGYLLEANKAVNKEYTLTGLFDVSQPGTYRFLSTCSVDMDGELPTTCTVWAEFMVE